RSLFAETGFRPGHLLVTEISLPSAKYAQSSRVRGFYRRLLQDLGSLPGVVSVGAAEKVPLNGQSPHALVAVPGGASPPSRERWLVAINTVTPGYFRTLGIPVRRGRVFREEEDETTPNTAVVSESFARRFFPNADPIGRHIAMGESSIDYEVVGV